MERTKVFPKGKGKKSHWHWQRKGNRKRWKRWCEIIGTSEHTENSKVNVGIAGKQVTNARIAG